MTAAVVSRWSSLYADAHAARLVALAPVGDTRRVDGAVAVVTGSLSNVDNGVVCEHGDLGPRAVAELVGWVADRRVPASWICAGADAPDQLRASLAEAGCREEETGVTSGAALSALRLPRVEPPAGVTLEEIVDDAGYDAWMAVADACGFFEQHHPQQRALLPVAGRHWLALRAGRPVGLATAFFTHDVALLEHVGVVPDERRGGIATALALVRLHEARSLGCTTVVFGTTPESTALYEPLAFTTEPTAPRRWFYLP